MTTVQPQTNKLGASRRQKALHRACVVLLANASYATTASVPFYHSAISFTHSLPITTSLFIWKKDHRTALRGLRTFRTLKAGTGLQGVYLETL